ncbi:hypothetical protein FVEN_g12705 [Fusarium venenatum]|nr:hypothetical protein FVEN_g12705 [Fusarium venenatum]
MQLYKQAKKDNPRFWPDVLNPNLFAYDVPTAYTPGSQEETITIFRHSWYSLSETQPAIQYTRGVISNDM